MKTLRKYPTRKQAEDAAEFLMTKGVPSTIRGYEVMPDSLIKFQKESVELAVQDVKYSKANELLTRKEKGSAVLPKLEIKLSWKKKSKP